MSDAIPFWRVDYRSNGFAGGVDMFYATTEEKAIDYILTICANANRDLNDGWYYLLWKEHLDIDSDCERVATYDWFGNKIPEGLLDVGWEYGHDLKPEFIKPEHEGCPICRENLEREIAKHT